MTYSPKTVVLFLLIACLSFGCDSNTEEEIQYQRASITQITQIMMPFANNNGNAWDALSGPDVYLVLKSGSGSTMRQSAVHSNINPGNLPITWTLGSPYTVDNLNSTFYLAVYDEDLTGSEEIARTTPFRLAELKQLGYPAFISVKNDNGTLEARISLVWYE